MFLPILSICLVLKLISGAEEDIEIKLVPGTPLLRKILPRQSFKLITSNIPLQYRYAVFQAHSHIYPLILLTNNDVRSHGTHVVSNNAGLVQLLQPGDTSAYVFLQTKALDDPINVYLRVALYTERDPIPGGCNMEFDVEISPFLNVSYDPYATRVIFQPASLGYRRGEIPKSCDLSYNTMDYDFYVYNLAEGNLKETDYFNAVSIMMDEESMKNNAIKINPFFGMSRMTFTVNTFRRQGMIFNVVAKNKSTFAPYVPSISYGCNLQPNTFDDCYDLLKPLEWVLAITGALLGIFLCFFGHRFFKTAMSTFGFVTSSMIVYIVLIRWSTMSYEGIVAVTLLVGIIGGMCWTFIWWFSGSPLLVVLLPGFDLGFLLAAVALFTPLGDLQIFQVVANYWLFVACCVLLVPIILISFTKFLHILSCTVIGSYAAIFLIDCFIDGSLRYILIEMLRRATISNYNNITNVILFQNSDVILSITWALVVILGTMIQIVRERGHPPFPVSDYCLRRRQIRFERRRRRRNTETDRLLPNNVNNNYRGRYQSIVF